MAGSFAYQKQLVDGEFQPLGVYTVTVDANYVAPADASLIRINVPAQAGGNFIDFSALPEGQIVQIEVIDSNGQSWGDTFNLGGTFSLNDTTPNTAVIHTIDAAGSIILFNGTSAQYNIGTSGSTLGLLNTNWVKTGTTQLATGVGINVAPGAAPAQSFALVGSSANGRDWFSVDTASSNGNGIYTVFGPYLANAGGDRSAQINITDNQTTGYAKFRTINTTGASMEVGSAGSDPGTFGGGSAAYMITLGAFDLVLGTNVVERMRLSASGVSIGATGGDMAAILVGTTTWDPGSTATGTTATTTLTVTGASVGDVAIPSWENTDAGWTFSAFVSSANTITVTALFSGAVSSDPGSFTLRAWVIKR